MQTNQDIYQNVTDRMIAALEAGTVPWRKPWHGGSANGPRNAISNKPYRGMNIWILAWERMLRGFEDNRWLTFKQAMAAKGKFKGEKGDDIRKGTQVILWKPMVKPVVDSNGMPVMVNSKPKMKTILFLRTFTVFNVEQFDGLNLKAPEAIAVPDPIEEAEKILAGYKDCPPIKYGFDHACYYPTFDKIEMPERTQFRKIEEFYSTIFHEMGHSTLHKSRLNREDEEGAGQHMFGSTVYAQEELVAEMTAAMLCSMAGIAVTFDNSAAYIQSWLGRLRDDPKLIVSAAGKAQKAVDYILGVSYTPTSTDEEE